MIPTPPDIHPDGRYNATQAARALGIGRTKLYRLIKAGILKPRFTKNELRARFRGKDLLAYWAAEI